VGQLRDHVRVNGMIAHDTANERTAVCISFVVFCGLKAPKGGQTKNSKRVPRRPFGYDVIA